MSIRGFDHTETMFMPFIYNEKDIYEYYKEYMEARSEYNILDEYDREDFVQKVTDRYKKAESEYSEAHKAYLKERNKELTEKGMYVLERRDEYGRFIFLATKEQLLSFEAPQKTSYAFFFCSTDIFEEYNIETIKYLKEDMQKKIET